MGHREQFIKSMLREKSPYYFRYFRRGFVLEKTYHIKTVLSSYRYWTHPRFGICIKLEGIPINSKYRYSVGNGHYQEHIKSLYKIVKKCTDTQLSLSQ